MNEIFISGDRKRNSWYTWKSLKFLNTDKLMISGRMIYELVYLIVLFYNLISFLLFHNDIHEI